MMKGFRVNKQKKETKKDEPKEVSQEQIVALINLRTAMRNLYSNEAILSNQKVKDLAIIDTCERLKDERESLINALLESGITEKELQDYEKVWLNVKNYERTYL